jgi:hypothetical protein
MTSTNRPINAKGGPPGAVGAGAHPAPRATTTRPTGDSKPTPDLKPGTSTISNHASEALND